MKPLSLIKTVIYSLPDPIQKLFSRFIRRQLICNKVFVSQYQELLMLEDMSDNEIEDYQLKKLKSVLQEAYQHVPYYKDLFDEMGFDPSRFYRFNDLKVLPIMTKDTVRKHINELGADNVCDYYFGETGGSTGLPLKVFLSRESIYREKAFIYYFWSKYGYDYMKSRIATFRGVEYSGKKSKLNPLYNEILLNPFLLSDKNIDEYIHIINRFKPDFLHGYPSAIANFCRIMNENNKKLARKIIAVFAISEQCSKEQKEMIENTLQCKVYIFYGHTERAVFAEQVGFVDDFRYSFNKAYGYTEIEDHADGNIVCTGFINGKMPLIRYLVDDEAVEYGDGTYEINGHRGSDVLYGCNGERFSQSALNFHDSTFVNIKAYQLYQEELGKVTCRVMADSILSEEDLLSIEKSLYRKCGNTIRWNVEQVERLELTNRGKFKVIVHKVKNECIGKQG